MDRTILEEALSALPLYVYFYADPNSLEFSDKFLIISNS